MNVHLRYFASFRETTGKNEESLTLHDEATVADARALLIERYPRLQPLMERAACAVNHRYVSPETALREGDEVVFIPPVGGGESGELGPCFILRCSLTSVTPLSLDRLAEWRCSSSSMEGH